MKSIYNQDAAYNYLYDDMVQAVYNPLNVSNDPRQQNTMSGETKKTTPPTFGFIPYSRTQVGLSVLLVLISISFVMSK